MPSRSPKSFRNKILPNAPFCGLLLRVSGQDSCISVTYGTVRWIAVALVSAAAGGGLVWSLQPGRFDDRRATTLPAPVTLQAQGPVEVEPPLLSTAEPTAAQPAAIVPEPAPASSVADAAEPFITSPEFIGPPAPEPEVQSARVPEPESAPLPTPTTIKRALPAEPAPPAPATVRAPTLVSPKRININSADKAELELLPGVGPALAQRIIDHRTKNGPFVKIEDLDKVKGIGPKTLEKLRPLVIVRDSPPARRPAGP